MKNYISPHLLRVSYSQAEESGALTKVQSSHCKCRVVWAPEVRADGIAQYRALAYHGQLHSGAVSSTKGKKGDRINFYHAHILEDILMWWSFYLKISSQVWNHNSNPNCLGYKGGRIETQDLANLLKHYLKRGKKGLEIPLWYGAYAKLYEVQWPGAFKKKKIYSQLGW